MVLSHRERNLRIMVDLNTREPPAKSLLNRADHELPSLSIRDQQVIYTICDRTYMSSTYL